MYSTRLELRDSILFNLATLDIYFKNTASARNHDILSNFLRFLYFYLQHFSEFVRFLLTTLKYCFELGGFVFFFTAIQIYFVSTPRSLQLSPKLFCCRNIKFQLCCRRMFIEESQSLTQSLNLYNQLSLKFWIN